MLRLTEYARRMGFSRSHAWNLHKQGKLPHPSRKLSERVIVVDVPSDFELTHKAPTRSVIYARVSTTKQSESLAHQEARLMKYCIDHGIAVDEVISEVSSGLNDNRRKLNKLLRDVSVGTIIIEHQDRLARMGFGLLKTTLAARGCEIIIVDNTDREDDLVADITDVLTVLCARFYGKRGAKARAEKVIRGCCDNE